MGAKISKYLFILLAVICLVYLLDAVTISHDYREAVLYFVIMCLCVKNG